MVEIIGTNECRLNLIFSQKKIRDLKINLSLEYIISKIQGTLKSKIKKITKLDDVTISVIPVTKTNIIY